MPSDQGTHAAGTARGAAASEVAETSRGPVEFARVGEPPYILFFHGSPGGYDQGVSNDDFAGAGFGTIAVSRPGYLRTPLSTGPGMEEQADAMAALLDVLEVDRVVAYGVSGGGPSAIQFAARHPDRTSALLLGCAITQRYVSSTLPGWAMRVLLSDPFIRLQDWAMPRFPRAGIEATLRVESTFDKRERRRISAEMADSPEKLRRLREMSAGASPMKERMAGFENDLARFAAIERLPLKEIRCPTLICHGTCDGDVPFAHAETAHRLIPNARLHRMENGWHLLWLSEGADEMIRTQLAFVREHSPPPAP